MGCILPLVSIYHASRRSPLALQTLNVQALADGPKDAFAATSLDLETVPSTFLHADIAADSFSLPRHRGHIQALQDLA